MNRRIVYKQQAKCNFCYNWFQVFSQIKFGLNICEQCIYKALNTSCFKLPTPAGHLYQVYLARRNISVNPLNQSPLLEKIDQYMHAQIRELLDKWEQITKILKSMPAGSGLNHSHTQNQEQIWKKTEFILKNDSKKFNSFNLQTIQQIRQDIVEKDRNDRKILCTPLKQKSINMSVKYLNKSTKKGLNRMDSKKSLRSYRQLDKSNNKTPGQVQNNQGQEQIRRVECSPFNSSLKRNPSSKNMETRQFQQKKHQIKSSITSHLAMQVEQESSLPEPINILKQRIYQAIQNTNSINKCIELVSYSLNGIDFGCYLANLEWTGVQVVKFVKVGLNDQQLNALLQFLKDKSVETLVLTSNNLTQESCRNLLKANIKSLHNIYLGKNQIFSHKAKNEIRQLKSKYNFFL